MVTEQTTTGVSSVEHVDFVFQEPSPGILLAHDSAGSFGDRCLIDGRFVFGRDRDCTLVTRDGKVSGCHFRIFFEDGKPWLEDLKSTNGTYVRGIRVKGRVLLDKQTVIRAGRTILVFLPDAVPYIAPEPVNAYGFAGRFYSDRLMEELREGALSSRNVLLSGESGSGKELAAHALVSLSGTKGGPLLIYNAARFASKEEATSTLFGVAHRFFSNVDAREGLIEKADGGALFIDEIHNLPTDAQRTLLRIMETGETARLGETRTRRVNVRFIIASNAEGATCGLAHDLYARLRHIALIPLNERLADVPSVFLAILSRILDEQGIERESVLPLITSNHLEALCLEDYSGRNARMLVDLADRVATKIIAKGDPADAVASVFGRRFAKSAVARRQRQIPKREASPSRYDQNKELIIATFRDCRNNLTETERVLKRNGLRCSRRWLAVFLEEWGERSPVTSE